jgi:16S rRNA G966 N2-methylase RsmD
MWVGLGLQSELGRDDELLGFQSLQGDAYGKDMKGVSVFDPVLCEIVYRWFSHVGGRVLDPFAGGSVRGILATALGRHYTGIDLRAEQVEANRAQAETIFANHDARPEWYTGDSAQVLQGQMEPFDAIFSCPPYGDLEVYSDLPEDLSTMDAAAFRAAYKVILKAAVTHLKQNRFAVLVVGQFRDKHGNLRDLIRLTIAAMVDAGCTFYNEAILVNAVGTGAVRARKQMEASRKVVKMHQTVLVFVKGDPKKASEELGRIDKEAADG